MLLRFNIKNVLSFFENNDGQSEEFSMIASNIENMEDLYITIKLPHIHGKTATVQRQNCHTKNGTATMSIFCI